MLGRVISTVLALAVYWVAQAIFTPQATLITGQVAGRQFDNSDYSYLTSVYTMNFFSGVGLFLTLLLLLALVLIWAKPVRDAIKKAGEAMIIVLAVGGGALLFGTTESHAFASTTEKTEAYTIMPNESAFWIPDVGANKDSQGKLDSEDYYRANKIAVKRFVIPHQKLQNSGGFLGWDYYVPTGRLIIVDRTPFSREWVDAHDRGTSNKKEGFPCQSKEGLNITAGVSIGTSVLEENSPKFLYRFGVKAPTGDRTSAEVIFTSVYYSRSLKEIMDDVGRKKVQTLVCDQIGQRTFDKANEEMIPMMKAIEDAARKYFADYGITLDFIGWADTLNFDEVVQNAVNRKYIAAQDEAIARQLQPYADILKMLAEAQATRAAGDKWNGQLPSTFVGPAPTVASPLLSMPGVPRAPAPPAPAR